MKQPLLNPEPHALFNRPMGGAAYPAMLRLRCDVMRARHRKDSARPPTESSHRYRLFSLPRR